MADSERFLARLRDRDERAFDELVRAHQRRVYSLVYRLLGDAAEAEDVAQEVFVAVFASIESFRGEASLATWICRIALNRCRSRARRSAVRPEGHAVALDGSAAEGPQGPDGPAHPARPDDAALGHELERLLRAGLARLGPEEREIVVLRDVEGLAYEEIAAIAEQPLGTVKSRLHRARLALKDLVERYMRGG